MTFRIDILPRNNIKEIRKEFKCISLINELKNINCLVKTKSIDILKIEKRVRIEKLGLTIPTNWVWFQNTYLPNKGQYCC